MPSSRSKLRLPRKGILQKPPVADEKPDLKKHLGDLDTRITQEMARCHSQYDRSRDELKAHHGEMEAKEREITAELDRLRPGLEKFLTGETPKAGLDAATAKRGVRYLDLLRELSGVRTAKTAAYGATVPAGEQAMGQAIGTPAHYSENEED